MPGTPRVTVLMSVYDGQPHLPAAIESILGQTFRDFEFLVIDDGSTDDTPLILKRISDPRLRLLRQQNKGLIASLNRGIREARGEFIARMDHDDISKPERLEKQVAFLDSHPGTAMVGSWFAQIDDSGELLNNGVRLPQGHEEIHHNLLRMRPGLLHSTIVFRRQAALDAGLYDPDMIHSEDVDFFARMLSGNRAANLPEVLYLWRICHASVCTVHWPRQRKSERLVQRAFQRAIEYGKYELTQGERAALKSGEESLQLSGRQSEALYQLRIARACLRGRHWSKALKHYRRAIVCNPFQWLAWIGATRALLHSGGDGLPE